MIGAIVHFRRIGVAKMAVDYSHLMGFQKRSYDETGRTWKIRTSLRSSTTGHP